MTFGKTLYVLALVLSLFPASWSFGQQDELVARLGSPYARERAGAIVSLIELKPPDAVLLPLLKSPNPRFRLGASRVLLATGSPSSVSEIVRAFGQEKDRIVREHVANAVFGVICRGGRACAGALEGIRRDIPLARQAARSYVSTELRRLANVSTPWSHHRELSRFFWLGSWGAGALVEILEDAKEAEKVRCLAAVALGRVDSTGFWTQGNGAPGPRFLKLLLEGEDNIKMALLYGAAYAGVTDPPFVGRIARYCLEDSFNPYTTEATLYYLYSLPDPAVRRAAKELARCVESNATAFSERCVYNAAVLLNRLSDASLAGRLIATLEEEHSFGGFWLFGAVLENLRREFPAKVTPAMDGVMLTALQHPQPQVRALGTWWWRDLHGELPQGVDLPQLLEEVRRSARVDRSGDDDADAYAQRSAVEILSFFKDEESPGLFMELLRHPNEAVRMATAVAVGRGGFVKLKDDLVRIAREKGEYASYGACHGLRLMEDERCLPFLVGLLESGNRALMEPALQDLRLLTGHRAGEEVPAGQGDWRRRAETWNRHLMSRK